MRITFLSPPANMTGGIRVIAIYAKRLSDAGHAVTVVSPPHLRPTIRNSIKSWIKGRGWLHKYNGGSHYDGLPFKHYVLPTSRPIISNDLPDADVVIATWWETAEWMSKLDASKGVHIYFIQHYEMHDFFPKDRVDATYRLPAHKIVIAKWLENIMRQKYHDANVDLVPNAVDRQVFNASARHRQPRQTVGFMYYATAFKGVNITTAAIKRIKQAIPDLRVLCFGPVPFADSPYWDASFEYTMQPTQLQIRDIYASCDVWLTASTSEGFNLPAMEAMACRTPVISTRTGWPEEAIRDGYNGYLIEVNDVAAMADRTIQLLSMSDAEWVELSENALETVKDASWEESSKLFLAALERAIARQHPKVE